MSRSEHLTLSTTAQSVTLTKGANDQPFNYVTVINNDGGTTADVYFTVTGGGVALPVIALASDTMIACTGLPVVPVAITGNYQISLSLVASVGTPAVTVIAA